VKQNVEWHLAMGFNTMVITDHNTMNHKEDVAAAKIEYEGRAIIILGMEWTTNRVHLNFLGLSDWDFEAFPIPRTPTDDQIKAAINEAHRQGAVVTINHYPWSLNQAKMQNHPTRDQAVAWGINFIEIINDDSHYENMYDAESVQFIQEKGGIGMITGTDMHRPDKLESGAVHGWTLLNATEFTEEAVMVELRAGRTEIIYLPAGFVDTGNYPENPAYLAVFPLAELGNIFIGMFSRGLRVDEIAITIGYVYLIFIGKEITMIVGDRIKKKKSNE
jgi:histidinol phosphatase-like PHP family hydrolase